MLLLEDDEGMHGYAKRLFSSVGFDVTVATSAAAGGLELAHNRHAVAIVDERLPSGSGIEVLRKARLAGSTIPAIVLTGFGTTASVTEAVGVGVIDYQCKPAMSDRILAAIRIALRVGYARLTKELPVVRPHPDVSLSLLSVFLNLGHMDDHQLRTQLVWAVADDTITFVEFSNIVRSLRLLVADPRDPESTIRRNVNRYLKFAIETPVSLLPEDVARFLSIVSADDERIRALSDEAVADLVGTTLARLSQRVHAQVGLSPRDCRLVAEMGRAVQLLANSREQVAQIGYQLGIAHPSAFDRLFRRALGISPTEYRWLLTGAVK